MIYVACMVPVALALAAVWSGATLWLATGSVRPRWDGPARSRDVRAAAVIAGCAGAVVALGMIWFFVDWFSISRRLTD